MEFLLFSVLAALQGFSSADEFYLRLSNGPDRCTGRVEILVNNNWGTVCDDDWDLNDAEVVCRELHCGTALRAPKEAFFGHGAGEIWLESLDCKGTESYLRLCKHPGFGKHNCHHGEDASVVCSGSTAFLEPNHMAVPLTTVIDKSPETEIITTPKPSENVGVRLVNGKGPCAGRVEVFYNATWGTVCDDLWHMDDAKVVCKLLNCGHPISAPGKAFFGAGTGPIWLDNVQCDGNEKSLEDCKALSWGKHDCKHEEDAGVVCSDHLLAVPLPLNEDTVTAGHREVSQGSFKLLPHASGTSQSSDHFLIPPENPEQNSQSDRKTHQPEVFTTQPDTFRFLHPDLFGTPQSDPFIAPHPHISIAPQPDPFQDHVTTHKPEHVTSSRPEHVTSSRPEKVTSPRSDNVTSSRPEHVTSSRPEHVTSSRPEHVTSSRSDNVTSSRPEHVTSSRPEHVTSSQSDNVTIHRAEHITSSPSDDFISLRVDNLTSPYSGGSVVSPKTPDCPKTEMDHQTLKTGDATTRLSPEEGQLSPDYSSKVQIAAYESHQFSEIIQVLKELKNDFSAFSNAYQQENKELRSIADNLLYAASPVKQLFGTLQCILSQRNIAEGLGNIIKTLLPELCDKD